MYLVSQVYNYLMEDFVDKIFNYLIKYQNIKMQKSKITLTDFRIEEVRLKEFKIFFYKFSNVVSI